MHQNNEKVTAHQMPAPTDIEQSPSCKSIVSENQPEINENLIWTMGSAQWRK